MLLYVSRKRHALVLCSTHKNKACMNEYEDTNAS